MEIGKARVSEAPLIQLLINDYAKEGLMLPRSLSSIYEHIRDFIVCRDGGKVIGTCSLTIFWGDLAEIRSLAIARDRRGTGIGTLLVKKALSEAKEMGIKRVFTLTRQVNFFRRIGFKVIDKQTLPQKIWRDCINCPKFPDNCDETAMDINVQLNFKDNVAK